ncbi:MAG: hypothetical protein R2754_16675 [Microthrixaceae bacterium]
MDDRDRALTDIAQRQRGLITRSQVEAVGLGGSAWRHRCRTLHWSQVSSLVWLRTGAPATERTLALAAILHYGTGAALSHHSAAALWGVPGFQISPIHVTVPRPGCNGLRAICFPAPPPTRAGRRQLPSRVVLHRPTARPHGAVGDLLGIPVVRPAWLLLQLAPWVAPRRLQRVLDNLWSRRLASGPSIARDLEPVMGRGRAGVTAVREMLERCGPDYVPPESNLEARLCGILENAGLPSPRRQVDLGDQRRWLGRVDLFWPQWLIVIEVDSDRYHLALSDREDDARRQANLEAAGYLVVRVTEFEVWHRPAVVVARLRDAIAVARRRGRSGRCAGVV